MNRHMSVVASAAWLLIACTSPADTPAIDVDVSADGGSDATEADAEPSVAVVTDVSEADRILTYCGGGIAASTTAMLLTMLGYQNVGLYDASLSEWAPDSTLPMETLPANLAGD